MSLYACTRCGAIACTTEEPWCAQCVEWSEVLKVRNEMDRPVTVSKSRLEKALREAVEYGASRVGRRNAIEDRRVWVARALEELSHE